MDGKLFSMLSKSFELKSSKIESILSLFCCDNIQELCEELKSFIDENVDELIFIDKFMDNYHLFLYTLAEGVTNIDDFYLIKNLIDNNIKSVKREVKVYTKDEEKKDIRFFKLSKVKGQLQANNEYIDYIIQNSYELPEFKKVWFVITKLHKPECFYELLNIEPNTVNIKNYSKQSLFKVLVEYYIENIKTIDLSYYKRIIVMMLESDMLKLHEKELLEIIELLKQNEVGDKKSDIAFVLDELHRHYPIVNSGFRINAVSYTNKKCVVQIPKVKLDSRYDFTNLKTFSVDLISKSDLSKTLIDDAFSVEENKDGTINVYIHIPDVDLFVERDSGTDLFMRSIGESVYAQNHKTSMIYMPLAKKMSLNTGSIKPTLSFIIKMDMDGNIINLDMVKGLVNVSYNLSRAKAEAMMKNSHDKQLHDNLLLLFEIGKIIKKMTHEKFTSHEQNEKISKYHKAELIIEEYNILLDVLVAKFCYENNIVFPYRNYLGKKNSDSKEKLSLLYQYMMENNLTNEEIDRMTSIIDAHNRVYYDTTPLPNVTYNNLYVGNVGNPLRCYMSVETDRLLRDLVIDKLGNEDYWEERIEKDCIEFTETTAKIRELYPVVKK